MSVIVIEPIDYKTLEEILELLETPSDIEVYLGGEFHYTSVA